MKAEDKTREELMAEFDARFEGEGDGDPGGVDEQPAPAPAPAGLVRLSAVSDRPGVDWLAPGLLAAGKPHLLAGDPGFGKTTLALEIAARMTNGDPPLPGAPARPPTGVLLVCPEDGMDDTIKPRLKAAGADLDRVVALDPDDPVLQLPADAGRLRRWVEGEGIGLIVVDPLPTLFPEGANMNHTQDVRRVLQPLTTLGNATGVATILIAHLNKAEGRSAAHRIGGSTAVLAVVRLALLVGKDPGDPDRRVLATVKNNLAKWAPSLAFGLQDAGGGVAAVRHLGPSPLSADDLCADSVPAARVRRPTAEEAALAFVLGFLEDEGGEAETTALNVAAEGAGFSEIAVRRARKLGGLGTYKRKGDGKQVVTLPDAADHDGTVE